MVFQFYAPATLEEALDILTTQSGKLKILAGGTDLMLDMRHKKYNLAGIVDVSNLAELKKITVENGLVRIGSMVTFSQLANSSLLKERVSFLAEAASLVGSPQIRNQGTIGGNIANASPAADSVVPLVALGAVLTVASKKEIKEVPLTQLLTGVGENNLTARELITEIKFRLPDAGTKSIFVKFGRRNALSIARISIALLVEHDTVVITDARVALGAVAPNPCRATELEKLLNARRLDNLTEGAIIPQSTKVVSRMLGNRPSAKWKNEAIRGLMREALHKLELL